MRKRNLYSKKHHARTVFLTFTGCAARHDCEFVTQMLRICLQDLLHRPRLLHPPAWSLQTRRADVETRSQSAQTQGWNGEEGAPSEAPEI